MTTTARGVALYIKPLVGTVTIVICTAGVAACGPKQVFRAICSAPRGPIRDS